VANPVRSRRAGWLFGQLSLLLSFLQKKVEAKETEGDVYKDKLQKEGRLYLLYISLIQE